MIRLSRRGCFGVDIGTIGYKTIPELSFNLTELQNGPGNKKHWQGVFPLGKVLNTASDSLS